VQAVQAALEMTDAEANQAEESRGELSGNFEQKSRRDDLWDDKTAHNTDAYLADDSIPAPVISEVAPPNEIEDALSTDDEFGGEATIAAPSIDFPDDSAEGLGFGEDATLHIKDVVKDDSGGWSGDATAAAPDDVVPGEDEEEIEVPMVSEEESLDDEPALPDGVDLSRDVDQDSATLAGVTSDFIAAGLKPPVHTYEPKARPEKSEVTPRPAPSPKQEKLGAIRLSKVAAVPESGVFEVGFSANEEVTEGDLGADSPLEKEFDPAPVSAMDFEFEDSAYDEGELPSKVKPKTEASVHRDLYDQAQEEYSALVAPKAVQPMSPVARPQGAMHIGSSNVPPASLSLSDMLHDPQARQNSAKIIDDPNQNRSATMLGRQIREVVRNDSLDNRPQPLVQPQPYDAPTEEDNDPELLNAPAAYEPPTYAPPPQPRGAQRSRLLMGALIAVGIACLATMAYFLIPLIAGSSQHLTIRTTPVGATVYVDEKLQEGTTPLTIRGLEPGISYQIRLEREGYEPISREVRLPPNRPLIWQIPLKPKPSVTSAN
jgi:hypothetical protein